MTLALSPKFKRAVAGASVWARGNKLKALACLSLGVFGASKGTDYIENALSGGAGRDQQLKTLAADTERFVPIDRQFRAVDDLLTMASERPDRLQAPVDKDKLAKDKEALSRKLDAAGETLINDFLHARDISLNDMDAVRGDVKSKSGWDMDLDGTASKQVRSCENYFAGLPKNQQSPTPTDLNHCLYDARLNTSYGRFLYVCLFLLTVGGAMAIGSEWNEEEQKKLRRRAAAEQRLAQKKARQAAQAAPPLVLSAPTKISRPLKLKLKMPSVSAP